MTHADLAVAVDTCEKQRGEQEMSHRHVRPACSEQHLGDGSVCIHDEEGYPVRTGDIGDLQQRHDAAERVAGESPRVAEISDALQILVRGPRGGEGERAKMPR